MKPRDRDFLIVLRGVKTDKLAFGDPRLQLGDRVDVRLSQSIFSLSIQSFPVPKSLVRSMLNPKFPTASVP